MSSAWRWGAILCIVCPLLAVAETNDSELDVSAVLQAAFRDLQAGRFDAGEQGLRQVIAVDPDNHQVRFELGTAIFSVGRVAEALELLEALREDAPEFYPVLNNLAWMYATADELHLRDGSRSVLLAQEAIFRQPGRFQIWNTLAEAYFLSGDYERSERSARQALRYAREHGATTEQLNRYRELVERAQTAARVEAIFAETSLRLLR